MAVELCRSKFALGVCGWAREKGMVDFCGIADNDPLDAIKNDVLNRVSTPEQALRECRSKVESFQNDAACLRRDYWIKQYGAYAKELEQCLVSNIPP